MEVYFCSATSNLFITCNKELKPGLCLIVHYVHYGLLHIICTSAEAVLIFTDYGPDISLYTEPQTHMY